MVIIATFILAGACGPYNTAGTIDNPEDELVVYSGRSESLVGPIIDQFQVATGITVRVKYGKTAEIAATLLEEGQNTPADIFFAQDPGGLGAVADAGMFADIPQEILDIVPDWARSPSGKWVGLSGRARTVVYNTENLSEDQLPDDIWDFVNPEWKGRVGWAPRNGSFQAMVTAMRVLWGEDKTRRWVEGMKLNEAKEFPKNTPIVQAVGSGEIDLGFVNHYYLYRFLQEEGENFAARNYHVRGGGPGGVVLVAGAGIIKTGNNPENAEKFLNFMLSTVAQQFFASQTYEYPLIQGVTINRLLKPLPDITNPGVDMASLSDLEGTQDLLRDVGIIP